MSPHSQRAIRALPIISRYLKKTYNSTILVEDIMKENVKEYGNSVKKSDNGSVEDENIDMIICLGGDGLILHVVSTLFPNCVPPIFPFNLGSLGFLATFDFNYYSKYMNNVFEGKLSNIVLRMRLKCQVIRSNNNGCMLNFKSNQMVEDCSPGAITNVEFHVLNELVIDRGPAPYLSNLQVLCDDVPITRVQADGLILATPTGSTAYNLSAGGSMVHPDVPAILFTPICPHSLSFRPVLFPHYVTLTIKVPEDSRATAWVCFDGRSRMELLRGDQVVVTMSEWNVPTFCKNDATQDWFTSISQCLSWNERLTQGVTNLNLDHDDNGDDYDGSTF